jgi:hypothetical protein
MPNFDPFPQLNFKLMGRMRNQLKAYHFQGFRGSSSVFHNYGPVDRALWSPEASQNCGTAEAHCSADLLRVSSMHAVIYTPQRLLASYTPHKGSSFIHRRLYLLNIYVHFLI